MEKTIEFSYDKETKGTLRFKEVVLENENLICGTLYIRKEALGEEKPQKVIVSLRTEE